MTVTLSIKNVPDELAQKLKESGGPQPSLAAGRVDGDHRTKPPRLFGHWTSSPPWWTDLASETPSESAAIVRADRDDPESLMRLPLAQCCLGEDNERWVRDRTRGQTLIAPTLLHFEIGNLCWTEDAKDSRDPQIVTLRSWPNLARLDGRSSWNPWICSTALVLARQHNLTFYDASYLWLARDHAAELISLDAKLVRAARTLGLDAPIP